MGTSWPLVLLALLTGQTAANGNVGCLFSEELCRQDLEWCFDDGAFGRCININDPREPDEHYRHSLDENELAILEGELKKLLEMGYLWSHRHTQCLLQAVLFAFQTGSPLDSSICDQYRHNDLQSALSSADEEFDPNSLAFIRFTPSAGDPRSDYADEVYYPVEEGPVAGIESDEGPLDRVGDVSRRSIGSHFSPAYNSPDNFRSGLEVRDFMNQQDEIPRDTFERPYAALRSLTSWPAPEDSNSRSAEVEGFDPEQMSIALKNILKPSYMLFKMPTKPYDNDNDEVEYEVENEQGRFVQIDDGRGYTEGGTVYPSDREDSLPDLIDKLNGALGFKRPERLDVKKPGPPYDPAFQEQKGDGETKMIDKSKGEKEDIANELPPKPTNVGESPKHLNNLKKKANPIRITTTPDYDIIDTNFAYINFEESSIRSWHEGKKIISIVAKVLRLPNDSFSHPEVERNEVMFKVDQRKAGMNASEVAKKIEVMKDKISKEIGVKVLSTGIGYKSAKLPIAERLNGRSEHEVYIVTVVVVGVLSALALSAVVLYLTKKHGHKLRNHVKSEGEPMSKLYQNLKYKFQDLCRARMSTKTPSEKEVTVPAQRITSLSKESDKDSPSSRSSTSSWSEEPALTNMDVATGQMVLSYMEEHLKNKERLESEWTALCAYEADPSATTIAQRPENLQKNRYSHAMPYDHARVVLNELSNITGSDYINASTITDHDPRNPAYIVTQGPLAHTAPDLWQMVWEQGCVAMVMLTRLGEADSPLCYHYWPQEGSETYHVYEVHLVSEHIWCDDYLVRSFYLKNLKTGETRTVTQFHFLSWPEGGVPTSTKHLLEFRRKVNKSFRGRSCPMVVHCSDGVGRSGAYVLLDMVLNRIAKGAKEIDVGATLEHIRDQRAGAVATKQQFQFVLQAVSDEVQAILKLLPQP